MKLGTYNDSMSGVVITGPAFSTKPSPQSSAPQSSAPISTPQKASSLSSDVYQGSQLTSGTGVIKKIAGGTLIGGSASALAASLSKSMFLERGVGPGMTSVGIGAAIGAGVGLLGIETGSETTNSLKNMAAGTLIGGGVTAAAQSISSTMLTNYIHGPSAKGTIMGAAVGAGVALISSDFEDKELNNVKNVAGAALLGGGGMAIASAMASTMISDRLQSFSPVAAGLGAALGAGIAVLNMEE